MAVFPPAAAREDLLGRLPAGARFARPSKWHITLAFLGQVEDFRTAEVAEALAAAPRPPAFRLRLAGAGRFGAVIWTGVGGDVQALGELRESVRVALDGAGFTIDTRPFRPHLTVSYRTERGLSAALEGYAGPEWPVTGIALVESLLGNYHTLHEWPLPPGGQ
ncbi:RNA 2',3'-cyclic phosphodiesterase [Actinoplanes regularis]|uniref:RNA 2',3'-cyclic phosphodiesterase n=1 Tax=Actinoplanes regularis TaxID=52697 RepID=A0A239CJ07_9ACTN|nr:RNA 2',3'-cyclic phosphodiesterase [Actinoplanes regularis]GIE89362.1 RNA 2',3'-cyclic phosphodiesterase [Actinoplanes regularis]SNS19939.1 2'-5' RNA ligase [Actinoplanes regularis]